MKLKKTLLSIGGLATLLLTGCTTTPSSTTTGSTPNPSNNPNSSVATPTTPASSSAKPLVDPDDLTKAQTLNMSVMYQKANTRMKFGGDSVKFPYEAANGKSYKSGDWKPVWEEVQENLNITINDVTDSSSTKIADAFQLMQANNFKGVDIAQGSAADIIQQGTTVANSIVDLSQWLDYMPNFKKFLAENPIVETNIKDAKGAIYYAPYFDGYNDLERMLMVRQDWVEKLLDSSTAVYDTTVTLADTAYQAYMPSSLNEEITVVKADGSGTKKITKSYGEGKGIIARQNALTTKTGAALVQALKDYIKDTYGDQYAKPSDLFCGQDAAYDADELIALFRCVKTNPGLLTGDASKVIVPFFPRASTNDRTADLWRFCQMWGVRGVESRSGYLYIDDEGKINDARDDVEMRDALVRLNAMYKEGLILKNFMTAEAAGNPNEDFRATLLKGNLGFATYDYNQTTTIFNDNADCKKIEDFLFTSILPAVADWRGDGNYFHFTESWRSVKTEGWFITNDAKTRSDEVFKRCLTVFDYFYSDEGNMLMSYGPKDWIEHDAQGNVVYIDYQGNKVPKLAEATMKELSELAGGNYTNYYRYWLGATYPIGYVKQQGMEYQTVSEAAKPGLDKLNKAIELGVLQHITVTKNEDHFYDMVPTTFALSATEQNALKSNFTNLDNAINNTKGKVNVWSNIVIYGFGGTTEGGVVLPTVDGYAEYMTSLNIANYVAIYQLAYNRM